MKGIELSDAPEDLACYGYDASFIRGTASAVAWPKSTDEVSQVVSYAAARGLSITCRGAGTGMTAGAVPYGTKGCLVLSFEKMARIIEIDPLNMTATVEPGVINAHLQSALAPMGLFYPPDPASLNTCTIGGNVAENAGGPRAVKYGVTRDYVMQVEAVLPSGKIINLGVRTHKGVVGYDLVKLLVGSEGTLAAITKITLKTLPSPANVRTMLATFKSLGDSGDAVSRLMSSGIIPRTLELMDRPAIEAVEDFRPGGLPRHAEALLLVEFDGEPSSTKTEAERAGEIFSSLGASIKEAKDDAERELLWQARRAVSPALHHLDMRKINEDVVVPRQRLTEMLVYLQRLSEQSGIKIINFGHAGDGNIHVNIMSPKDDQAEYDRAYKLVAEIFRKVLELGGTISGEHGVGLTKNAYIGMEIGTEELALMRGIKALFDPGNIMNPGKVFPPAP